MGVWCKDGAWAEGQRKHLASSNFGVKQLPRSQLLFWPCPIRCTLLRDSSLSYPNSSHCSAFCTVHFFPWTILWLPCHLSVLSLMSPSRYILVAGSPCSHLDMSHKTSSSLRANAQECQKKRSSPQFCVSESVFYVAHLTCCRELLSFMTFYSVTYFWNKLSKLLLFVFLMTELDRETSPCEPSPETSPCESPPETQIGGWSFLVQYLLLIHVLFNNTEIFHKMSLVPKFNQILAASCTSTVVLCLNNNILPARK